MTTDSEWTRASLQELRHEIDKLSMAIYGDRLKPPNGGGLYGELKRMNANLTAAGEKRQAQIDELSEQIADINRRVHPLWWDYVVIGGAIALMLALALQVAHILGVFGG